LNSRKLANGLEVTAKKPKKTQTCAFAHKKVSPAACTFIESIWDRWVHALTVLGPLSHDDDDKDENAAHVSDDSSASDSGADEPVPASTAASAPSNMSAAARLRAALYNTAPAAVEKPARSATVLSRRQVLVLGTGSSEPSKVCV
jgi:hypothetical protein